MPGVALPVCGSGRTSTTLGFPEHLGPFAAPQHLHPMEIDLKLGINDSLGGGRSESHWVKLRVGDFFNNDTIQDIESVTSSSQPI